MRQVRPGCGELPPLCTRLEGIRRRRVAASTGSHLSDIGVWTQPAERVYFARNRSEVASHNARLPPMVCRFEIVAVRRRFVRNVRRG